MQCLHFAQKGGCTETGYAVRRYLEDDGAEVGKFGNEIGGDHRQVRIDPAAMRIEPMTMRELRAGEMHFPDTLEWQPCQHVVDRRPAVPGIDPEVVEIEQDAAIRCLGDCCEEVAIVHFGRLRLEVIDAGLERE